MRKNRANVRFEHDSKLRSLWESFRGAEVSGHDSCLRRFGTICGYNENGLLLMHLKHHPSYEYEGWRLSEMRLHYYIDKELCKSFSDSELFFFVRPGTLSPRP